jgi:hypothetical protein
MGARTVCAVDAEETGGQKKGKEAFAPSLFSGLSLYSRKSLVLTHTFIIQENHRRVL